MIGVREYQLAVVNGLINFVARLWKCAREQPPLSVDSIMQIYQKVETKTSSASRAFYLFMKSNLDVKLNIQNDKLDAVWYTKMFLLKNVDLATPTHPSRMLINGAP